MSKPKRLSMSYNDNIKFSYTVDIFNQRLHVKLARGVPEDFMKDAISEAYEDYNSQHRDAELIHPSAVEPIGEKHIITFSADDPPTEDNLNFIKMWEASKPSDESFIETINGRFYPYLNLYVPNDKVLLNEAIYELIAVTELALEKASGLIWSDQRERIYKAISTARTFIKK